MTKCLFFLCFCLFPFVAFSSTFTSQNPIDLPTAATFSELVVLDLKGIPLDPGSSYRIVSTVRGAGEGDVYLGASPNSEAPCKDGVFRYHSGQPRGTPVIFIKLFQARYIYLNDDINIQFDILTTKLCVSYTIWKVDEELLATGGTILRPDSSWFRIGKALGLGYNLLYCPAPSSPLDQCQPVGEVSQDGKTRLALVEGFPHGFYFEKA